jgi:hypothetical protein
MTEIILSSSMAWILVNKFNWQRFWNVKPINCDVCLSGWFALILTFDWLSPFYMSAAMLMTIIINKYIFETKQ